MIEVKNLTKKYGKFYAIRDVNFTVGDGEIVGFLGRNGAGKTTTMNIITGYIEATSGDVLINGVSINKKPKKVKKLLGYMPEGTPLYYELTVKEFINYMAQLRGVPRKERKEAVKKAIEVTGLQTVQNNLTKFLSRGYKQRVSFAGAIVGEPDILILDEPTVGLDPNQIIEIRSLIKKLGKRHTVILSSHILPEIQAVCDRIIIINKGVVAADGTADDIAKNITNEHKMTLRIEGQNHSKDDKEEIVSELRKIDGIKYVRADMEREKGIYDYDVETDGKTDVRRAINKLCAEKGWNILMLQLSDLTLEDIFLKITMGDGIDADSDKKAQDKKPVRINLMTEAEEKAAMEAAKEAAADKDNE